MPNKINYSDPNVQLIRELLNRRPINDPLDAIGNPNLPQVPHPSGFRPDPLVIGNQSLGKAVYNLNRIAPELRGRVETISTAPTPSILNLAFGEGQKQTPEVIDNLRGALGTYTPSGPGQNSEIWLRPQNNYPRGRSLEETLAHEMGHVAGYQHGIEQNDNPNLWEVQGAAERLKNSDWAADFMGSFRKPRR